MKRAGRLPTLPGKRSAPLITGQLVPLTAASQNSWMGGVDELMVAGQLGLDVPGPLVGEHLDLAGRPTALKTCPATDSGLIFGALASAAISVSMKPACTATTRVPWWWSSILTALVSDHSASWRRRETR